MALLKILLAFLSLGYAANANVWDYTDLTWNIGVCESGSKQSPINLTAAGATGADYSDLNWNLGYKIVQEGTLGWINDGKGIRYVVDGSSGAAITGGPLGTTSYTLGEFQLHWGSKEGQGSEHEIEGESFDGELHLVHYRNDYSSVDEAIIGNDAGALAIVAILLKVNTAWDQFTVGVDSDSLNFLRLGAQDLSSAWVGPSSPSVTVQMNLDNFMDEITDITGFYSYEGSLTYPECNEIVQWIVMETPLYVRRNGLLTALRNLRDDNGDPLVDNYRPPRAIADHVVSHYTTD